VAQNRVQFFLPFAATRSSINKNKQIMPSSVKTRSISSFETLFEEFEPHHKLQKISLKASFQSFVNSILPQGDISEEELEEGDSLQDSLYSTSSSTSSRIIERRSIDVSDLGRSELTLFPEFSRRNSISARLKLFTKANLTISNSIDSIPIQFYKYQVYIHVFTADTKRRYTFYSIRVQKLLQKIGEADTKIIHKRYSDLKRFYMQLVFYF
jgi:hypothetical protein